MGWRAISWLALAGGAVPGVALGQDAAGEGRAADPIIVRARLAQTAREEQAAAPNLINIQAAEDIAKYPDVNAAEALSRIPGVQLSIDTAEGRFVNIRGLDGNLNGATFGGVVLLNTQPGGTYFNSAGRAVEFDTVPVGAIDRIVVTKSGRPDREAEGIGGSVELSPRTAVGLKRLFAEATLVGGIETFRGNASYRDELAIGGPLGGSGSPLSFVITQYLHNDRRSFDDIEAGYVDAPPVPDKAFAALELRKYDYRRQRFGFSGELDFAPAAAQRIYLRASLAGYNEHVYRNRLEIDFAGSPAINPANANGLIDTATTVKTLRDEDETHRNLVVQLGTDSRFGAAHVEAWGAYSRATYRKHYDYNATFANPNGYTLAYDNITNPNYPAYTVTAGTGLADPANFALAGIGNGREADRDQEWSYAASLALPLGLAPGDEIKLGGKLRFREKIAQPARAGYAYAGAPLLLSANAAGAPVTDFYRAGYDIGPAIAGDPLRRLFDGSGTALPLSIGGYFDDTENVTAAFAQYSGTWGALGVLAGARFEHTKAVYRGIGTTTDAAGNVTHPAIASARGYDNVFPTIQLRWRAAAPLVLRATWSTGLARPGFYQTQQATNVDLGGLTVSTGNPALKPTFSHNFDLALEYYLPGAGIVAVGAFDKEMRDYIVTYSAVVAGYGGNPGLFSVATYANASHAYARGIEASLVERFDRLPGALGGLGIDANATYVASGLTGSTTALPGTFPWTWNAALFYERGPAKARIAAQFESTVLFGLPNIYQDSRFTLDVNASYDVAARIQLFANAKNLTNAPLRFYEGAPNRPIQREFYDVTLEAGLKLRF